jgi:DNA-binding GntR family transcriptional regulator
MSTVKHLPPATRDGSASRRVAAGIRDSIARGEFAPGMRLRQEEIAERFGASRVPVREALKELETEGLVTLVANAGAWVSRLTLRECEEVYQTRERLEPLLLHYSAPHLTADTLDSMDELARAMADTEDVVEFLRLDREVHMLSYSGGETLMLGDLVRRLWNTTQQYRRAYTTLVDVHGQRIVHDEHRHIVATLRDGDVEGAAHTVEGHIRRTRRMLAAHPEIFTPTG